jgi:hypothetical protein
MGANDMPLRTRAITLLFTALVCLPAASITQAQNVTVAVGGGVSVKVPTPEGFREVDTTSNFVRSFAQVGVRPDGRLLAFYVPNDDAERVTRGEVPQTRQSLMLQTARFAESADVTDEMFGQFATMLETEQKKGLESMKSGVSEWNEQVSRSMSAATGQTVKLHIEQPVSLGVFGRQAHAVSWALLVPMKLTVGDVSDGGVVASAVSVVHVSGKVLFVYVYHLFNGPSDVDWVRSTTTTWVTAILGANAKTSIR